LPSLAAATAECGHLVRAIRLVAPK
jgi:hypothetical protein